MALSRPFDNYGGQWEKSPVTTGLKAFFEYLKDIPDFNIPNINKAIEENWVFDSNIPMGYGLGSSGALCAAAVHSFYNDLGINNPQLKKVLAQTESYFHGNSSGLDPITSYLNVPILSLNGEISVVKEMNTKIRLHLLDSKIERETKPLVEYYINRCNSEPTFKQFSDEMSALNENLIRAFLENNEVAFRENIRTLSQLQYENLQRMIPKNIKSIWEDGLNNEEYFMKLSGAGGGGFFLTYGDINSIEGEDLLHL